MQIQSRIEMMAALATVSDVPVQLLSGLLIIMEVEHFLNILLNRI